MLITCQLLSSATYCSYCKLFFIVEVMIKSDHDLSGSCVLTCGYGTHSQSAGVSREDIEQGGKLLLICHFQFMCAMLIYCFVDIFVVVAVV